VPFRPGGVKRHSKLRIRNINPWRIRGLRSCEVHAASQVSGFQGKAYSVRDSAVVGPDVHIYAHRPVARLLRPLRPMCSSDFRDCPGDRPVEGNAVAGAFLQGVATGGDGLFEAGGAGLASPEGGELGLSGFAARARRAWLGMGEPKPRDHSRESSGSRGQGQNSELPGFKFACPSGHRQHPLDKLIRYLSVLV